MTSTTTILRGQEVDATSCRGRPDGSSWTSPSYYVDVRRQSWSCVVWVRQQLVVGSWWWPARRDADLSLSSARKHDVSLDVAIGVICDDVSTATAALSIRTTSTSRTWVGRLYSNLQAFPSITATAHAQVSRVFRIDINSYYKDLPGPLRDLVVQYSSFIRLSAVYVCLVRALHHKWNVVALFTQTHKLQCYFKTKRSSLMPLLPQSSGLKYARPRHGGLMNGWPHHFPTWWKCYATCRELGQIIVHSSTHVFCIQGTKTS